MEFTNQLVAMSTEEQKASFYRKTYMHVALAILAFIFVETALLRIVPSELIMGICWLKNGLWRAAVLCSMLD